MSKIVFLDVDGTLIDYDAKCPESAARAVELARANGHKVYICTGCSKAEIAQRDLPELDGMIGANGGYVEDAGEVVMHQALSLAQVRHIVDWCNERHLGFYLEANSGMYINSWFVEQAPEAMKKYAMGKGASEEQAAGAGQAVIDGNTWGGKDEQALFGDLGPKGITKKHAIQVLLEHLGASQADTISFGDAKIDLSMFELCAYNVAMGNGGPEIKEAADYITDDVNEDGLFNAFKHLGLI